MHQWTQRITAFLFASTFALVLSSTAFAQSTGFDVVPEPGKESVGQAATYQVQVEDGSLASVASVRLETPVQTVFAADSVLEDGAAQVTVQYAQAGPHKLFVSLKNADGQVVNERVYPFTVARAEAEETDAPGYDWTRVLAIFSMGVAGLIAGLLIARVK